MGQGLGHGRGGGRERGARTGEWRAGGERQGCPRGESSCSDCQRLCWWQGAPNGERGGWEYRVAAGAWSCGPLDWYWHTLIAQMVGIVVLFPRGVECDEGRKRHEAQRFVPRRGNCVSAWLVKSKSLCVLEELQCTESPIAGSRASRSCACVPSAVRSAGFLRVFELYCKQVRTVLG